MTTMSPIPSKITSDARYTILLFQILSFRSRNILISHVKSISVLSSDTCIWNGLSCVYKQLGFDEYVGALCCEVSARKALLQHFSVHDSILLSQYGVCFILAIVVDGEPPLLCGIFMLNAGIPLDELELGRIKISHFISLLRTTIYCGR
jgi:hypothetical protein